MKDMADLPVPHRTDAETPDARVARLESELKAAGRVAFSLQEADTVIVRSNERLRASVRDAIEEMRVQMGIEPSKDLAEVARAVDGRAGLPGTFSRLLAVVVETEKAK